MGDLCEWKGADKDVPRGTVGTVVAIHDDGDVEVSFPPPAAATAAKKSNWLVLRREVFTFKVRALL